MGMWRSRSRSPGVQSDAGILSAVSAELLQLLLTTLRRPWRLHTLHEWPIQVSRDRRERSIHTTMSRPLPCDRAQPAQLSNVRELHTSTPPLSNFRIGPVLPNRMQTKMTNRCYTSTPIEVPSSYVQEEREVQPARAQPRQSDKAISMRHLRKRCLSTGNPRVYRGASSHGRRHSPSSRLADSSECQADRRAAAALRGGRRVRPERCPGGVFITRSRSRRTLPRPGTGSEAHSGASLVILESDTERARCTVPSLLGLRHTVCISKPLASSGKSTADCPRTARGDLGPHRS